MEDKKTISSPSQSTLLGDKEEQTTAFLLGSLNRGGTETLLLDVFRNAARCGLNALGIYRKTGLYEQEFQQSGTAMIQLKPSKNILSYLWQLRKILLTHQISTVHAQQPLDALYAWLAIPFTGIQLVLSLHGFDYTESKVSKAILTFILKRTQTNIYVSDYQRQYYTEKYKLRESKQLVVYNGLSFDKLQTNIENNIRKELGINQNTLLLGSVGNFNQVRDQLSICRFLAKLKSAGVEFHFVFAGKRIEGSAHLYDQCVDFCHNNQLDEQVHFLGVRNDIPQLLEAMDVFVYASAHDTFGIAVVEALATATPVFVNNWDVMTEITENGKLATLYKTKDEADLFQHFSLFLHNKQAYQQKAIEAARIVRQKYSIETHIKNLQDIYF